MGREYYKSKLSLNELIKIQYFDGNTTGLLADFIKRLDIPKLIVKDEDFEMESYSVNGEEVVVYNLNENWKCLLMEEIMLAVASVENMESIIAEVGIRKVFKISNDLGWNDDVTMAELSTNEGIAKLFYCVLYSLITFDENAEEMDYGEWEESLGWEVWQNDEEEDEEDDDRIVPITDEELDRIGGKVAMCA